MKNKGNVLNSLFVLLAGLIHYPAKAQQKHGPKDVVYHFDV